MSAESVNSILLCAVLHSINMLVVAFVEANVFLSVHECFLGEIVSCETHIGGSDLEFFVTSKMSMFTVITK